MAVRCASQPGCAPMRTQRCESESCISARRGSPTPWVGPRVRLCARRWEPTWNASVGHGCARQCERKGAKLNGACQLDAGRQCRGPREPRSPMCTRRCEPSWSALAQYACARQCEPNGAKLDRASQLGASRQRRGPNLAPRGARQCEPKDAKLDRASQPGRQRNGLSLAR